METIETTIYIKALIPPKEDNASWNWLKMTKNIFIIIAISTRNNKNVKINERVLFIFGFWKTNIRKRIEVEKTAIMNIKVFILFSKSYVILIISNKNQIIEINVVKIKVLKRLPFVSFFPKNIKLLKTNIKIILIARKIQHI